MIRVLIVGDVRLYREGIERALRDYASIDVVGTASEHQAAIAATRARKPDIVLFDYAMRDSLSCVRGLLACVPGVRVVLLTVPEVTAEVIACAEAGVVGYVTRESSIDDLVRSIEAAQRDELCCSPRIAGALFQSLSIRTSRSSETAAVLALTPRESAVLERIEKGLTNKEIAVALGIEVATVKNHVHNLLEKMNVQRRGEAAARFRQRAPDREMRAGAVAEAQTAGQAGL